jgi:hypothetical protein
MLKQLKLLLLAAAAGRRRQTDSPKGGTSEHFINVLP